MSLTRINREERIALTPFSTRHHMAQILDALVEVVDESVGELQMIECVDCEEYLREIDRLESRLAAALDALRDGASRAEALGYTGIAAFLRDAALAGGGQ